MPLKVFDNQGQVQRPELPAGDEVDAFVAEQSAHIVEMPKVTPNDVSIASPAKINIALSRNPNPTNGIPVVIATHRRTFHDGRFTASSAAAAAAASVACSFVVEDENRRRRLLF